MSVANGTAVIRVTRCCPFRREVLGDFADVIDGEKAGRARRRVQTSFEVPPGKHTLVVRGRRFIGEASNSLQVEPARGSTETYECRTKSRLGSLTDKEEQAIERREFHWVRLYETEVPPFAGMLGGSPRLTRASACIRFASWQS
jgi:hypothetical protein